MLFGVLTAAAVIGGIVLLGVLLLQRGREGVDLSLGGLLRVYLYLASLAGSSRSRSASLGSSRTCLRRPSDSM